MTNAQKCVKQIFRLLFFILKSMIVRDKTIKYFFPFVYLSNNIYILWLAFNIEGGGGIIFWFAEFASWLLNLMFFYNHYEQKHPKKKRKHISDIVDVYIPVVNEPLSMVEKTIEAAKNIDYINKKIYLLDDSGNKTYRKLAKKCGIEYIYRENRINAKAGNLNNALKKTSGDFILVIDADQIVDPDILRDCTGYFRDKKVAFVTTRQRFDVHPKDFNHDHLFYEHMQPGKHQQDCPISCGSGVIYRRTALEDIGGFQEWNIVEDLYTSFVFHENEYKSVYVNKPYSLGTAPECLSVIYKQRGTWALDTLRVFFRKNPLFRRKMNFKVAMHYIEICYAYFVPAIVLPILFLIPIYSLIFNETIVSVNNPWEYALVKTPAIVLLLAMYYKLCKGFRNAQYWAGLFPVYFKALVLALLPWKVKYKVTDKTQNHKVHLRLVLPQITIIVLSVGGVVYHINIYGYTHILYANLVWVILTLYWLMPVILHGLNLNKKTVLLPIAKTINFILRFKRIVFIKKY